MVVRRQSNNGLKPRLGAAAGKGKGWDFEPLTICESGWYACDCVLKGKGPGARKNWLYSAGEILD